jgi:hypothetical protein
LHRARAARPFYDSLSAFANSSHAFFASFQVGKEKIGVSHESAPVAGI